MSVHAVHINDRDTCVTVTEAVKAGDTVEYSLSDGTKHSVTALNTRSPPLTCPMAAASTSTARR